MIEFGSGQLQKIGDKTEEIRKIRQLHAMHIRDMDKIWSEVLCPMFQALIIIRMLEYNLNPRIQV